MSFAIIVISSALLSPLDTLGSSFHCALIAPDYSSLLAFSRYQLDSLEVCSALLRVYHESNLACSCIENSISGGASSTSCFAKTTAKCVSLPLLVNFLGMSGVGSSNNN